MQAWKGDTVVKLVIGCDHGAVELKDSVKKVLAEFEDIQVEDVGTFDGNSVDYPDIAEKVCGKVAGGEADRGIVLCGTGLGISIAANKVKGIRAALCHDVFSARMSREHNDANVLAMPGRYIDQETARSIMDEFLNTDFEGGRHIRRIEKIPVK